MRRISNINEKISESKRVLDYNPNQEIKYLKPQLLKDKANTSTLKSFTNVTLHDQEMH